MRHERREKREKRRPFIRAMYRGNLWAFFAAVLASLLTAALNLGIAWVMQEMIDTVSGVPGAYRLPDLAFLVLGIVALIAVFKGMSYFSRPRFMEKAMSQYKEEAFQRLMKKSIAAFGAEHTAHYISAFSNDAAVIEAGYLEKQFEIMSNGIMLCGSLAMMLAYSPVMTLVSCMFFLLPIGAVYITGNWLEKAEREISEKSSEMMAALKDSLSGFSVIKSFRAEAAIAGLFTKSNADVERAKCRKRKLSTVISGMAGAAGVTAQMGTFLIGTWLALSGWGITPGVLMVFLDLTANVINPVRDLPEQLASRRAALALIDKLAGFLDANVREEGKQLKKRLERGIEVQNVSFGYETQRDILHGINTVFEAGKCYAVVGASGSGKSTLLNLLMASHGDYAGEIYYDGCEIRDVSSESLYDMVSLIQQNVFVFNVSIRENITMFAQFEEAQIERAIDLSGLRALMEERGGDFLCGENGCNLSGGEKQRIAIARSLLRRSSVLLMDEATSALDARTGRQVLDSVQGLAGMTRIVVTHSLDEAFLRGCDGIVVLRGGCVEEQGTFEALMERRGYFYSLYTICASAA